MKSKRWPESKKKLPSSEHQEVLIQKFNHEPFNPMTLYGESETKLEKIPEQESLDLTVKDHLGSYQA